MKKNLVTMYIVALLGFVPAMVGYSLLEDHIISKRDAEWSKAAVPIFQARQIPMRPTDPEGLIRLLDENNDFHRSENGRLHNYRPSVVHVTFEE